MEFKGTKGIARTVAIVVIVVVILIVAVAGYFAFTATTTSTPTTSSISNTQSSSSTAASSTTSSSASSSGTVMSTVPVKFATANPAVVLGAVPLLIAEQQSIFQKYDPNIQLDFSQIGTVIPAVAAGTDQMGIVSNTNIPTAIDSGTNVTIVSTFLPPTPYAIFVSASSKINSTAQLKGLTWASTQPGSLNDVYLRIYAADNNLGNVSEVTVASTAAQVTAVISGKAQACICSYTTVGTITAPGPHQLLRAIANVTTAWPNLYVFTTPAFAQQHPNAVKAVLAGLFESDMLFNNNENNATVNMLLNSYPALSVSAARLIIQQQVYSTTGSTSLTLLQDMINTMVQYNLISKNLSASAMVTPGFCPITT